MPYQTFQAADAAFVLAVGNDAQWRRVCEALGEPKRADDPRWAANPGRVLHRDDVVGWLAGRFASAQRAHWIERLQRAGVPAGPVRDVREAVGDPALAARGMVAPYSLPDGTVTPLLSLPWCADGERPPVTLPPPALGQHTAEFLSEFAAG